MSEKFVKFVTYIALIIAVIIGIALTVVGGVIEGWKGVAVMLGGMSIFIMLLYLYNRQYK